ncbi:hypothetical protein SESBI_21196 [Sesbania bispinosa]|nr:hypothetical protein SESBI_21196 [Sesbania bispinosa]
MVRVPFTASSISKVGTALISNLAGESRVCYCEGIKYKEGSRSQGDTAVPPKQYPWKETPINLSTVER